MKYFLHDTNAFQDEKLTELYIKFGYEGIGLFFTALERLAAQEKPIKTTVLKKQLLVGKKLEKVWTYMEEIGLISSNNGETFNENLLKFSEKYQIKKEKAKERVAKFRENQADTKNVTRYNRVSNARKVKVSKEIKEINKESRQRMFQPSSKTGFWSVLQISFSDYINWQKAESKKKYVDFPIHWTPRMIAIYKDDWLTYRQKRRSKLLPESIQSQINQLANLTEPQLRACIQNSVSSGYQGLFPDNYAKTTQVSGSPILQTSTTSQRYCPPAREFV